MVYTHSDITSVTLPHPIERVRGGDIVVTVNVTFNNSTTSPGFAVASSTSTEHLQEAYTKAVSSAVNLYNAIKGLKSPLEEIFVAQVSDFAKTKAQADVEAGSLSQDVFTKLTTEKPDFTKQDELNTLCDSLGMPRIDLTTEDSPWSMLDALAVIAALKRRVKPLEYKAEAK
jgi:hypothetical protein